MAGRAKGQIIERKPRGYVIIKENEIRVKVDADCLVLETKSGIDKETQEIIYSNDSYFGTWDSLLTKLVRIYASEKISQKGIINFKEAQQEYISAINELKVALIGGIELVMKDAFEDIKKSIRKFNI